jgi:GNAT superfamily N-acetyltransferase
MSRNPTVVRDAQPTDLVDLLEVWSQSGHGIDPTPGVEREAAKSLANIAADPDERLVVCEIDGRVVGAISLRRAPLGPLHTENVVHTSYLLVLPGFRRHGCAHALLDAAVAWAEEKDIAHVTAITASNSRDTNRFLARLGLSPIATVRAATTVSLRDKLRPAPGRSVSRVLAQRRSMRRRFDDAVNRG